jgi:protein JSN1
VSDTLFRLTVDARPLVTYYDIIPIIPDRLGARRPDVARLRDLRKRLDSNQCSQEEIDDITRDLLDDCAMVCFMSGLADISSPATTLATL